jgi:hypothetical protein
MSAAGGGSKSATHACCVFGLSSTATCCTAFWLMLYNVVLCFQFELKKNGIVCTALKQWAKRVFACLFCDIAAASVLIGEA